MLRPKYDTEDDVPEDLKPYYSQETGSTAFTLQVTGMVPTERLTEFRDSNVELRKQLEEFKPLEGKVAEALKAIDTVRNFDDKKLVEAGKVEEVIAERLAAANAANESALRGVNDKLAIAERSLSDYKVESALMKAGGELGMRPEAADDLKARGRALFRLDDAGNLVAMTGDKVSYDPTTGEPLSVQKWTEGLVKAAPHLFQTTVGTGGGGAPAAGGNAELARLTAANPFRRGDPAFNLTEQGKLRKHSPALAAKLNALAKNPPFLSDTVTNMQTTN